jgi:putative chitinase
MTDFRTCQRRLIARGYDIGGIDNIAGPKTWSGIMAYVGRRPLGMVLPYGAAAAVILPRYGISTRLRIANFIGQAAHETGGFRLTREIWGPTDAQNRYEGRADLGNTQPGDGYRYRGRGIFQITGRACYDEIGAALKVDLEDCPELAESPPIAVESAAYFWQSRGLNTLADTGDEDGITRRINGGTNGIAERRALVDRCKALFA